MRDTSRIDWPPAVEVLNEDGGADLVLLCEHASNHIPHAYGGLGLEPHHLQRHIAWDIGAAELTRRLSARLDAVAFLSGYSRLLIDLNRPTDVAGSIPLRSEDTEIPGNAGIDAAERARRADVIFRPFHERVATHLEARIAQARPTLIVTIHSFTPVFLGVKRPWHAGVLFGSASGLATHIKTALASDPTVVVDFNVPYVVSRDGDYAVLVHGDDRGIPAVLLEIRQDLIAGENGVSSWADRLASALPTRASEIAT